MTNQELEKMVETSDEWIVSRTGMKERRIAGIEEPPSFMGLKAAKKPYKIAKISSDSIDMILVATMTPDYITPSTSALFKLN